VAEAEAAIKDPRARNFLSNLQTADGGHYRAAILFGGINLLTSGLEACRGGTLTATRSIASIY
jgi:hypothetical protein